MRFDEETGDGYMVWTAGSAALNGQQEGISIGGKKVASTDLYTEFLFWAAITQMVMQ